MFKFTTVCLSLLLSFGAIGQSKKSKQERVEEKETQGSDYKNLFQISADGFGWSSTSSRVEATQGSSNIDYDKSLTTLSINYARKLTSQFWLQGILTIETTETDYDDDATYNDDEDTDTSLAILAMYDFDEDTTNAFFIKGGLGIAVSESESGSNKIETDANGVMIGLGKRWSLESWGLPNASYTLALDYMAATGDIDSTSSTTTVDLDVQGLTLQLVQVDLFF